MKKFNLWVLVLGTFLGKSVDAQLISIPRNIDPLEVDQLGMRDDSCGGIVKQIQYGGYAGSNVKTEIPVKAVFVFPKDAPKLTLQQSTSIANGIVNKLNADAKYKNHQFIKFKNPQVVFGIPPEKKNDLLDANKMATAYGSQSHLVIVVVKNLVASNMVGYASGLRYDWRSQKDLAIVDLDKSIQYPTLTSHLVFELLGIPVSSAMNNYSYLKAGISQYKTLPLSNIEGDLAFKIFADAGTKVRTVGACNLSWNNGSIMFPLLMPNISDLFITTPIGNTESAFNFLYSRILSSYYDAFVKGKYAPTQANDY